MENAKANNQARIHFSNEHSIGSSGLSWHNSSNRSLMYITVYSSICWKKVIYTKPSNIPSLDCWLGDWRASGL